MGKKWIYRLKKEDFANVAQRLNVTLDGRLEDMRKALSEYYSETDNDTQLVDIWDELEATYHDKGGPNITLTNAEGDNLAYKRGKQEGIKPRQENNSADLETQSVRLCKDRYRSANSRSGSTGRKTRSSSWNRWNGPPTHTAWN